jgi:D-3-phosphoglycerate dehydrogenase / 2-oxoglutarate reductase
MKNKKKILCVILARGGSKGIPKKNIFLINGHPLISYSIFAGLNSRYIDKVVVSTDSKKIKSFSEKYGADVPFLRPKKLSMDKTLSVDSLKHAVKKCEEVYKTVYDYVLEIPAVSPFRSAEDIDTALEIFFKNKSMDSLAAYVSTGEKHPIRLKRLKNNIITNFCKEYPEDLKGSRRQDFETSYIRNGSIYLVTRKSLFSHNSRNGGNHFPFVMSEEKSLNIDNKFDLEVAKLLIENDYCKNKPQIIKKNEILEKQKKVNLLVTLDLDYIPKIKEQLCKNFNCFFVKTKKLEDIKRYISKSDAWLCSPTPNYKINENILKYSQKLKIICTPSTGTNHVDKNFCKKKKIKVWCLLDTNFVKTIHASSEFTFLALLASLKKFSIGYNNVRAGYWRQTQEDFRGYELFKKNVGIIGYGRIGKNIFRYCKTFGAKLRVYDPYQKNRHKFINNSIKEVLSKSDVVLLSVNLTKKTNNFFGKKYFSYLKKGSILINTSRAEVIDDDLLIRSLKNKMISFAFTDLVRYEQSDYKKSKLFKYSKKNKNLVITPHMAGLTYESETKAAILSIKFLNKFFKL